MIAQLLYRDAGNYKTVVAAEVPVDLEVKVDHEYQIEDFGLTEEWLWAQTGNGYDHELDHNLVTVEALYNTMEEFMAQNPAYEEKPVTLVMPVKKEETKYYLVNPDELEEEQDVNDMTDEEFMDEAERQGMVYSQDGFVEAFNNDDFGSFSYFLRILTN